MKKGVLTTLGVVVLGAGSAWFYAGHQFEKRINHGLEMMKDPTSFVVLSYDETKVNQWLFNVTLKNPTLIIRLPSGKGGEAAAVPALYTSKLEGSLTASTLPWSAHTTFTFSGSSLNEVNLGERFPFRSHGEDSGFNVAFNLYHKPFWYLRSYESLLDFSLHGLKGVGVKADKTLLTSVGQGQPLFSSGPAEAKIRWDIDPKNNVQIEMTAKAKDQQFHEELGSLFQLFSAYALLGKNQYDSSFSAKFNFADFRDFFEEALKNEQANNLMVFLSIFSSLPDFELKVPKTFAQNATGSSESKMEFSNEKGKELKLAYEGAFHYTDQWRPYFVKALKTTLMQESESRQFSFLKDGAALEKTLEALLPYRNSMTVDRLEYKIKASPKDQEVALKVKYFLNQQGVKLDLESKLEEDIKLKGSLKIYDYEKCFNDLATYVKRALEALEMKNFAEQVDHYHQVALNLVNQLADVETDDGVKVAKIELDVEPKEGKGKIGKKDLKELMPMMMMLLMPAITGAQGGQL